MDTRSLETASAATLALVGVTLLAPASTFSANPTAFAAMTALPEWAWGGLLMVAGLVQSYAVARRNARGRRWAALAALATLTTIITLVLAHKALAAWQGGLATRVDALGLTAGAIVGVIVIVDFVRALLRSHCEN